MNDMTQCMQVQHITQTVSHMEVDIVKVAWSELHFVMGESKSDHATMYNLIPFAAMNALLGRLRSNVFVFVQGNRLATPPFKFVFSL